MIVSEYQQLAENGNHAPKLLFDGIRATKNCENKDEKVVQVVKVVFKTMKADARPLNWLRRAKGSCNS